MSFTSLKKPNKEVKAKIYNFYTLCNVSLTPDQEQFFVALYDNGNGYEISGVEYKDGSREYWDEPEDHWSAKNKHLLGKFKA